MSSIINPFSFVDVTISQDKPTSAICLSFMPPSNVLATALPDLSASALSALVDWIPLPRINCVNFDRHFLSHDKFLQLESTRDLVL
jgi:hypothetical protein